MGAYSVSSLASSVTFLRSTCCRQSVHFSFPNYTHSGVFPCGCSFLLVKLVIWTSSLERGAQPFKNECWQGLGMYFSVSGVQMRKHSCSASVVIMFLLGAHPAVFWTASPWPFLADSVIKGGRERRAKFNLTRRSDWLVPAQQKSRDTSWILAIYRAAQN